VDATLKGVVGLITGADVEARCAALVVLTHLKADEERVVRTVGEALNGKNAVVRDFAVGYFEVVRPREGVAHLVPLLDSHEEGLRGRTVNTLVAYGAAAVSAVKPLLKDAPRRRLNAIIDLCARVRSSAALDILFTLMASDDFDTNRAACDALIASIPGLNHKARADLFGRTDELVASAKGQRTALVAAAKLFGALGEAKARRRLFGMLDKEEPHAVRTHALGALVQCLRGQKLSTAEVETLLPMLNEDDEAGILRPAIQLLEEQTLDRSYLSQLNQLAESPQPVVKRFAVQKLGGFESGAVVKTLIGYVTDDSYARRDQATSSLKKLPAARAALMKEFLECEEERKAWTLADILLAHERSWKRDTLEALWKQLQDALEERDDRLYTAYFHFLNNLDAVALAQRVRSRADALRKKKDFATTAKWLGLLKDSPAFDAEAKFALAVAELKSHKLALAATIRRHDTALDLLRGLARSAFPAAEQLRKERALSAEELFYVAFNFAEGDADEKALARELLDHLAGKYGRTKIGKAAKNKLKLLGKGG
jgi:HEAT repeat protein